MSPSFAEDEEPTAVRVRPAGLDRRTARRLPIEVDVDVEGAAQRFRSVTGDLSATGMFVSTHHDIPIGTHVMLAFKLPNGAALEILGVVRWRRADRERDFGLGVSFFCLDPEARKTLEGFCSVREPLYSGVLEHGEEADDALASVADPSSGAFPVAR